MPPQSSGRECHISQHLSSLATRRGEKCGLAVNYSPEAARLLAGGQIDFDLFKCPSSHQELPSAAELRRPCYVHFDGWCGHGIMTPELLADMEQQVRAGRCRYVNTHLGPPGGEDEEPIGAFSRALRKVGEDYQRLCAHLGAERVLLENVPWESRPGFPFPPVAADPQLLTAVLERWGGWLLLDLAHVQIAAAQLEHDPFEYLEQMPTRLLRELHVTGVGPDATGRVRDSMPMTDRDWELCTFALDRVADGTWARPWVVTFEYGGVGPHFAWRSDEQVLAEQLPRLERLLRDRSLR